MKEFTVINPLFSPIQLLDENGKSVGAISLSIIGSTNDRIVINNEVFRVKYNSFFSRDYRIFDQSDKLIFKTDNSKNRFIYYGAEKEFFNFKNNGWFSTRLNLYRSEELIISLSFKNFLKIRYRVEVANNFDNHFIILTFLYDYISSQNS